MSFLTNNFKVTHFKIVCARHLYNLTRLFIRENERIITRHGIKFEVELNEAIDFNLFLFGDYQKHVYENKFLQIFEDSIIFDVGANSGVMSLFFAAKAKKGFVYSFEPTHYALGKLKRNLELNPGLANRIELYQCFVSSKTKTVSDLTAYSSWPLSKTTNSHKLHKGVIKPSAGVGSVSIDDFCREKKLKSVNIIKIDTDGHEMEVLLGGKETIKKFKPGIIFEAGLYLLKERGRSFKEYIDFFNMINYRLISVKNQEINYSNFTKFIPQYSTQDIIALPE